MDASIQTEKISYYADCFQHNSRKSEEFKFVKYC